MIKDFLKKYVLVNNDNLNSDVSKLEEKIELSKLKTDEIRELVDKYTNVQRKLEIERKKFKLIFEKSPIIRMFISTDGKIDTVNDTFINMTGYTRELVEHKSIFNIVHDDDYGIVKMALNRVLTEKIVSKIVHRYIDVNNNILYMETTVYLIEDNIANFIVIASEDITHEITTNIKLRDKQHFIKKVISIVPSIIYVFDVEHKQFVWSNKRVFSLLGYTRDEITKINTNMLSVIMSESDYSRYLNNIYPKYKSLQNDVVLDNDFNFIHKNGNILKFNIKEVVFSRDKNDDVKEILGNMTDITGLSDAYQQLRLNVAVLNSATDSIIITDEKGDIIFVNNSFSRISGYNQEELLGKNPRMLKSGKHSNEFYNELWKTISSGNIWEGEITNKNKNGELYTEQTTITPVSNGDIHYYFAIKVLVQ